MRRILATSIAAAIPAMLSVHVAEARTKPAPPPASGAHSRPAPSRAYGHSSHGSHGRPASEPANDTHNRPDPRANDVQVSADDDGGSMQGGQEPQGSQKPQGQGSHQTHGAQKTHDAHQSHHAHQSQDAQQSHGQPASRPDTGAGTEFSEPADADSKGDPALPQEAVEALQEAGQSGNQGTDPGARIADPAAGTSQLVLRTTAGTTAGRSVTLRCDPPGGTHPKAAEACADVAKSRGDLKALPADQNPRACFMIYAPVTVSAQGDWRGQPVKFTTQFPNTCVMRDKTGSIFDF